MKYFFIKFQLLIVSVALFLTFGMTLAMVVRFNKRLDFTREKLYSLDKSTVTILEKLKTGKLEALAFYPQDDPARGNFEIFLKEIRLHIPNFKYVFYDPDRVPTFAKQYRVENFYTVILKYEGRQERIVSPSEESFTNALLRLANPKKIGLCFVSGHTEAPMNGKDRNGLALFKQSLENNNYDLHEIILLRDRVPPFCNVTAIAGPHNDFEQEEFDILKKAFREGSGILLLIDPMDAGEGKAFVQFLSSFGIILGEDVIVDKMSRVVGGDFLVPLISQYVMKHPITANFNEPTFLPVTRSVQPTSEDNPGVDVVPLALSSSGSWAETNLAGLEKGQAAFEAGGDLAGPVPVAVAVEMQPAPGGKISGRLVTVGDSDFITNAYVNLSGNQTLALNMIQWLARDDRFIQIHARQPEFKPLFLSSKQRVILLGTAVVGLPLLALIAGLTGFMLRRRES